MDAGTVAAWGADALVVLHLAFVVFVVAGALLVWRWAWVAWLHLPAAAWGVWIECTAGICPLTPLENAWRRRAAEAGVGDGTYEGGFVENYVLPVLYPVGLTPGVQLWLGAGVLVLNGALYGCLWWRWRRRGMAGVT